MTIINPDSASCAPAGTPTSVSRDARSARRALKCSFPLSLLCSLVACGDDTSTNQDDDEPWQTVYEQLDGALLSVWGTAADDVWAVGADARDGDGPLILHFDGDEWERLDSGQEAGTLWWVFGFDGGPVFMGGDGGVVLRYDDGEFELMDTPGTETVFGIWGADADDVWAVGGASESTGGFAWRYDGESWSEEASLPDEVRADAAVWKVHGSASDQAWLVGSNGVALEWDGDELSETDTGVGSSLFTVHTQGARVAAVGGLVTGIIVERDASGGEWEIVTPEAEPPGLAGVALGENGGGIAVGNYGSVLERDPKNGGWEEIDTGASLNENLHGVWIDPAGGVWAVGGQTLSEPFTDGVLIHRGDPVPGGSL